MKITTDEGEFELVRMDPRKARDAYDPKYENLYTLKPVKKTEKKQPYVLLLCPSVTSGGGKDIISQPLYLTPTAADKLSEAISALRAAHEYYKESIIRGNQ